MNKIELSKRIDVSLKTLYNWEETKPELIKLIKLGLEKEKELENGSDKNNEKLISEITNKVSLTLDEQLNQYFERRKNKNWDDGIIKINKLANEKILEINKLADKRQNELNKFLEELKNDKK